MDSAAIPPMPAFDIEPLDPITVETSLKLPRIRREEVSEATQAFSAVLAQIGGCEAHQDPALLVELLSRCLLAVSHELLESPEAVLEPFSDARFEPWFERRCEIITLSAAGAVENREAVVQFLSDWGVVDHARLALKTSSILIAVGSLATIGRLPIQSVPEADEYN